ncbi:MAG: hypothetical protein KDI48_02800 [Xanthomonadales bacterium]|nr:hypothetical protein [Xanthomonadales bacterium]
MRRIWWCLGLVAGLLASPLRADSTSEANPALQRLTEQAREQALLLDHDQGRFSGPAYERLLAEGRQARFFLIGEEHGIAENPLLAAALFGELVEAGYRRLTIEISAPMAATLDRTLRQGGLSALADLYAEPGGEPAFFGMQQEAELLASVRAAVDDELVLWGIDYEVGGDRQLLRELAALPRPDRADASLSALLQASRQSWARFEAERDPQYIFSFSGDPELVRAVRTGWPDAPPAATAILQTLEDTFAINRLWISGQGWRSNELRGERMRQNFLRHWRQAEVSGAPPRVMVKLGASHLVRGRNMTDTFDLGALLPELAAIRGERSFSLLVLPGIDSQVARLDPVAWAYQPAPAKDGYDEALEPLLAAAVDGRFTLIDLRPLRPLLPASRSSEALRRVVMGFDMLLVLNGSTPSSEFAAPAAE